MSGFRALELGPVIVLVCQLLHLMPVYYQLNALIMCGRKDEEWTFRTSLMQSQILLVAAEMLWAVMHPQVCPPLICSFAALAYATLQGLHLAFAFNAPAGNYHSGISIPLQAAAGLFLIPVTQIGTNYTLQKCISPARYRILGWILAVCVAVANLTTRVMANATMAVSSSVIPAFFLTMLLFGKGVLESSSDIDDAVASKTDPGTTLEIADEQQPRSIAGEIEDAGQDGVARKTCTDHVVGDSLERSSPSMVKSADVQPAADEELMQQRISFSCTVAFLVLGCAVGTIGEALMDTATSLAIRKSLQSGNQDLALTNQVTILASMCLAYISETRVGGGAARHGSLFILAWTGCQLFRGAALHAMQVGSHGVSLLAMFAFLDKYTGPLGGAALDAALLKVLRIGALTGKSSRIGVPSTLLWTSRMVIVKVERPLCQLVLLYTTGMPVERVAWAFTLITCAAVLAIHGCGSSSRWPFLNNLGIKSKSE